MLSKEEVINILEIAKTKLQIGWCSYAWARDKDGHRTPYDSEDACAWCIGGAVRLAAISLGREGLDGLLATERVFGQCFYGSSVTCLNDYRCENAEDAIRYIDRAIKAVKAGSVDLNQYRSQP